MSELQHLKPGDYVYYSSSWPDELRRTRVVKVTPSGRINTVDGSVWNPNGSIRGAEMWSRIGDLQAATPELDARWQREQDIKRLQHAKYSKCDSATLRKMVELLDMDEGES